MDYDEELRVKLTQKLEHVFDEYGLAPLSRIAVMKWIMLAMEDSPEKNANEGTRQQCMRKTKINELLRLRGWVLHELNRREGQSGERRITCNTSTSNIYQSGCPSRIPHLRALSFWDSATFPWVKQLEDGYGDIKRELLGLRGQGGFQPYRSVLWSSASAASDGVGGLAHDKGDWNVYYLILHNMVKVH